MRNKHFHSSREAKLFPNTCYKTAALGDTERHDGKISQYHKYGHKAGFVFVCVFFLMLSQIKTKFYNGIKII